MTVSLSQAMELRREVARLTDEAALLRIAQDRADGALADAATVPTGNLERGIRALTAERDGLKRMLEKELKEALSLLFSCARDGVRRGKEEGR